MFSLKLTTFCVQRKAFSNQCFSVNRYYGSAEKSQFDLCVIGGGIIGTASAREIQQRHPHLRVCLLEKESQLAAHQSSYAHNSGVVHAGIYYTPGSLKAKLCVEGLSKSYKYFDEKKIRYKKIGKLIVATDNNEVNKLMDLFKRATQNGVPDIQLIDGKQIPEIEPYCRGLKAIWSPHTGIVDYSQVAYYYGLDFQLAGGKIQFNFKATQFHNSSTDSTYPITIESQSGQLIKTKYILTCAGLYSDKLAELTGCPKVPKIVPFRGEYLVLAKEKCHMIKGNIYPVPDPRFPFLGVHFTPKLDGSVLLGPNAVLAFKREGYSWSDISLTDLMETIRYPGFLRMASKYLTFGVQETIKSAFISLQVKALQRYVPDITAADVHRGPAGVRAQALNLDGSLVDDFIFHLGAGPGALDKRVLHCRNAPSPGATSSLPIGEMIADKIEQQFQIK